MKIAFLYSSGWWNTRLVGEYIAWILKDAWIQLDLIDVAVCLPENILDSYAQLIFAAPTYDHGILHEPFYRFLHTHKDRDLSKHGIAVIGLGDAKYDDQYTVESATLIESYINQQKWSLITPSLRINKHPLGQLETLIKDWTKNYITALESQTTTW